MELAFVAFAPLLALLRVLRFHFLALVNFECSAQIVSEAVLLASVQ